MTNFKFQIKSGRGKDTLAFLFLTSYFLLLTSFITHAQAVPEFFATWRAGAYAESGYPGKILPVPGVPVTVSFELIDGGKLVDLSKSTIRWVKNGKLIQSGTGLKTFTFTNDPLTERDELRIKIVVASYRGADIDHIVTIPFVAPEVVIHAPYPEHTVPTGTVTFRPLFYYWGTTRPGDLSAQWSLQGERVVTSGNDSGVNITIPADAAGNTLTLAVTAKNLIRELETAKDTQTLFIAR